jgi:hypothetical protein
VLQAGTGASYRLTSSDVGRRIQCVVRATNNGGTGVAETGRTVPIQ